jgi:hypothetical protein
MLMIYVTFTGIQIFTQIILLTDIPSSTYFYTINHVRPTVISNHLWLLHFSMSPKNKQF